MDEALRRQLEHAPLIGVKTATAAMEFWKRVSCPWYAVELPTPKDFCPRRIQSAHPERTRRCCAKQWL